MRWIVLGLMLVSFGGVCQERLSLQQIIDIALDNNYSVKIARNNLQISANNYTLGNAGFLPVVDATLNRNFSVEDTEILFATGEGQNRENARNNNLSWGGALTWTIVDGGRMFFNYDRLEALQIQSEEELKFAIETLIFNVEQAFYQAALEKERLALFQSNLEFSQERVKIAKDKYEVGKASKIEYLQAQTDLNADKSAMFQQREVLEAQKLQLVNLMGIQKDSIDFEILYDIQPPENLSLDELLNTLHQQNAQLKSLKYNIEAIDYNYKMLISQQLPELDVFVGYNTVDSEAGAGFLVSRVSNAINYGLNARITLFDGFNLQRQKQNVAIEKENAQYLYEQRELELETRLKTIYISYQNNIQLLALENENLEVAKENNDIAQERYRIGLSSPLELREAQVNFVNAEIRYQNAAYSVKRAESELLFLAGVIDTTPN